MCKIRGHNEEGRLFLVDTGAMVSVLPLELYNQIEKNYKTELKPAPKVLRAGNNTKCDVRGVAEIDFMIADEYYKQEFYVCADSTQPILGIDFQTRVDMYMRPGKDELCIGDKRVPCFRQTAFKSAKVALIRPFVIPADSEMVVPARIKNGGGNDRKICLVSPVENNMQNQGVLLCNALTVPKNDTVPIRILNYTDKPVRLFRGKVMGKIEPVVGFSNFKEDSDDKCTCDCDCLRYQRKVASSPDELPCCHKIASVSSEERFSFMMTHTLKFSDEIFKGGAHNTEVPEHLKELFLQTLPHLESSDHRRRLVYLLASYADVFAAHSDDVGRTDLVKHHIDTGDSRPIHQRCRRFARSHVEIIRDHVKKLAETGTIRPSNSEWAANCVVVRKKDGGHRVCIDYRDLNAVTLNPDSYLIPRIDDTLDVELSTSVLWI
jgi:hypothetical protein